MALKESLELVDGVSLVGAELFKDLKDGFQVGKDGAALVGFLLANQEKLAAAFDGVQKVLPEIKAAPLSEKIEFGVIVAKKVAEQLGSKPEIASALELGVKIALVVADHVKAK